jgi:hypothetical protein
VLMRSGDSSGAQGVSHQSRSRTYEEPQRRSI